MDVMKPTPGLLAKLGSLVVHADEGLSEGGSNFDLMAFRSLLDEPDVKEWIKEMNALALLPVKR